MNTEPNLDFTSIGQLACLLTRSVRSIEAAAAELSLSPAMRLNGIIHFDASAVEQLTEHFRDKPPFAQTKDPQLRRRRLAD